MRTILLAFLATLFVPAIALAAPAPSVFLVGKSFIVASSSPGNAYIAGASVVLTARTAGDVSAIGGSIIITAPIAGDATLIAGSVNSRAPMSGDLRAVGGSIAIDEPVAGDMVAFGYSVTTAGRAGGSVFIVAADTTIKNGASGPVAIYGNNITLDGIFAGDVRIGASGRVALAPTAVIRGTLIYQAPEPAVIPASAIIQGGVEYTSASYLPDAGTSRALALVSVGFFLFVRILGALILAGLLAGLFSRFAEMIVGRAYGNRIRNILLTMLLGFAILVATPILLILLSITFVGLGLAFFLLILYALLTLLSVVYAGILLGSVFIRRFVRRETILWHDGVLGMLILSLVTLVPVLGTLAIILLVLFTAGTLLQLFFSFAFPHEDAPAEGV